jgi:LysM repeat protein
LRHQARHARPPSVTYPAAVAAVAVTAGGALAAAVPLHAAALHPDTGLQLAGSSALSAEDQPGAPGADVAAQAAREYVIRPGDTLSGIAAAHGLSWPQLWAENDGVITNPDIIQPGWRILLQPGVMTPALQARLQRLLDPPPPPAPAVSTAPSSDAPSQPAAVTADVSTSGMSGFEACVIQRESGGNPDAQNPDSTASGLFGFLNTTWTAVTGLPGPARDYSVAAQDAAFAKAFAEDGTAPWAAYDGC